MLYLANNQPSNNEPQKPQNFKEMLRKSPASNLWATIFKNADSS